MVPKKSNMALYARKTLVFAKIQTWPFPLKKLVKQNRTMPKIFSKEYKNYYGEYSTQTFMLLQLKPRHQDRNYAGDAFGRFF